MIEERALVIGVEEESGEHFALLRTQQKSACDSCQLKNGCGQGTLSKITGSKSIELRVPNSLDAQVGDVVMVAIPEDGLLMASCIMYLFPLLLMVALAVAFHEMLGGELATILGGGLGLSGGFYNAYRFGKRHQHDGRYQPQMTSLALSSPIQSACR